MGGWGWRDGLHDNEWKDGEEGVGLEGWSSVLERREKED